MKYENCQNCLGKGFLIDVHKGEEEKINCNFCDDYRREDALKANAALTPMERMRLEMENILKKYVGKTAAECFENARDDIVKLLLESEAARDFREELILDMWMKMLSQTCTEEGNGEKKTEDQG